MYFGHIFLFMDESIVTETVRVFQNELDQANSDALMQLNKHIDQLASLPLSGNLPQYNDSLFVEQPPNNLSHIKNDVKSMSPIRDVQFQEMSFQLDRELEKISHRKHSPENYLRDFSFGGGMTQDTINTEALFARAEALTDDDSPQRFQKKLDLLKNDADLSLSSFTQKIEIIQKDVQEKNRAELTQLHGEIEKKSNIPFNKDAPATNLHKGVEIRETIKEMKTIPSDENSRGICDI